MKAIADAILAGATGAELTALPLPSTYRAAIVRQDQAGMFEGMATADKDRKSVV